MPKARKRPKTRKFVKGEYVLPFGKHKGKTFDQIRGRSFRYIVWLSGHLVDNTGVKTLERNVAERIGTKNDPREDARSCLHCEFPENGLTAKQTQCELVGETLEDTTRLIREHPDSEYLKSEHGLYTAWLAVKKNHPDAVNAAQAMLEFNELCLRCGKFLILPEDAGEDQVDMEVQRRPYLHNQC